MDKRVQRVGNAACLGGISHARSVIINLYEGFANDYLTVTNPGYFFVTGCFFFIVRLKLNLTTKNDVI